MRDHTYWIVDHSFFKIVADEAKAFLVIRNECKLRLKRIAGRFGWDGFWCLPSAGIGGFMPVKPSPPLLNRRDALRAQSSSRRAKPGVTPLVLWQPGTHWVMSVNRPWDAGLSGKALFGQGCSARCGTT